MADTLGDIMARAIAQQQPQQLVPQFSIPQFSQFALPNVALDTRGQGLPYAGAGMSMPFAGGEVSMQGGYQPQQGFDARLGYRRQF